jgi:hypothetical protein
MTIVPDQAKSPVQNFFDAANRYLLSAALLSALLFFGYVLYQLYWPVTVLEPKNVPYPVVNKELHAGDRLTIVSKYCKYGTFPTTVSRQLQGETYITLAPLNPTLPNGCHESKAASTVIPPGTPPGTYRLVYSTAIQVNAFRTITVAAETEEFLVLPN